MHFTHFAKSAKKGIEQNPRFSEKPECKICNFRVHPIFSVFFRAYKGETDNLMGQIWIKTENFRKSRGPILSIFSIFGTFDPPK